MNAGECLRANQDAILASWRERALAVVKSSSGVSSLILNNELSGFLSNLADALSNKIEKVDLRTERNRLELMHFSRTHGTARATSIGYTLADMILEINVLREVVFEFLERGNALTVNEMKTIFASFESAVLGAAARFADVQREHIEEFTLTLAHDLRNPITVAKANAQMISRHAADTELSEKLAARIDVKMDQLEAMLRELLDVSRFRAGRGLVLDVEEVQLAPIVTRVLEDMRDLHGERFEMQVPPELSGCWNPDGLRRILENLLINALKYGSPTAPVRVAGSERDGRIQFIVHNEGRPIPPEHQNNLFKQYDRGGGAASKTGWGLGLALVRAMAEAHDGTVSVQSTAETGTNFIVDLPKRIETCQSGAMSALTAKKAEP